MTAITNNVLTITRGVTYSSVIDMSHYLGAFIPPTWTKIYFTVKDYPDDTDAEAILQIVESNPGVAADGILYLDGVAATALIQAYGSLVVTVGTITIAISSNGTLLIPAGRYGYDIKALLADGSSVVISASAICIVAPTETAAV